MGKVTMFRGPESGTKTTLSVIACARYLKRHPDRLAVYIDGEEKHPKQFTKSLGMDGARFAAATPDTAEETIDFVEHSLRDKSVGILVLDSIAAMIPKIEIEASADEWQRGLAARMINKMARKIIAAQKSARMTRGWAPTVILVNQERVDLSIKFGNPLTVPGGRGQLFAASLSIRLRTLAVSKADDGVLAFGPLIKVAATVVKNSFGPKGRGAEYLMAMEDFAGLRPGEARDEGFVYLQARNLNLISKGDDAEEQENEIYTRGPLYYQLREATLQAGMKK